MSETRHDRSARKTDLLLADAMEQFAEELKSGRRPDMQEFLGRYPDLADELRTVLPGLEFLNSALPLIPKSNGE